MADTQTMKGLDGVLDKLKALPPAIVSKRGGPVKAALRKGAVVMQKAFQTNIRRVVTDTAAEGYTSTQVLEKAVVVRRDPNPQRSGANERYRVMIARGRKYGDRTNKGKPVTAIMTARYLEFGTEDQTAEPFATPAYMSTRERSLNTVVDELGKGIDRIVKKIERGTK